MKSSLSQIWITPTVLIPLAVIITVALVVWAAARDKKEISNETTFQAEALGRYVIITFPREIPKTGLSYASGASVAGQDTQSVVSSDQIQKGDTVRASQVSQTKEKVILGRLVWVRKK